MAPGAGRLFPLLFALDICRLLLVWRAYHRLRSAYGGKRAIAALDALRLDIADGTLDGTVNVDALRDDPRDFWTQPDWRTRVEARKASWRRYFDAERRDTRGLMAYLRWWHSVA